MNLLHYTLGFFVFIYMTLLVVLPLWVYIRTGNLSDAISVGSESETLKRDELTPCQAKLLMVMSITRKAVIYVGASVVAIDLISISIRR